MSSPPAVARAVARAAGVLLLASAVLAAQPPSGFTLGDSRERVRQVQGLPDLVERLVSLHAEVWSFGASTVTFDPASGRVVEFVNRDGALKVVLEARRAPRAGAGSRDTGRAPGTGAATAPSPSPPPIALGDASHDVLSRLGTPWAYTRDAGRGHAFLAYGRSVIRLDLADQRVSGWIVRDSSVRVDPRDLAAGEAAMGVQRAAAAGHAVAPATLRATVQWRDDDGDGFLAPGEAATVTLALTNDGPGEARDVRASLRVESPATGVVASPVRDRWTLAPGATRRVSFRLVADSAQRATEVVAVALATEANGFDLAPALRLRIPARSAGAPRLVVREARIDDASRDGRLAPREIADVTLRLANAGTAATGPLSARLLRGADLFLAAGARDSFSLGSLAPGDEATVAFAAYTNSRAADTALHLELADATGRVLARLPVALPLTGTPSGVLDVAAARDGATGAGAPRRTTAAPGETDVHAPFPRAAVRRPDAVAVVLGVERYRALPDARFAERDAALLRRYAVQAMGVSDDAEHLYARTGRDVTSGELRKLFGEAGWLARRVTENTDLVVFFAGHGAPDAAGREPYLLPFDADPAYIAETGFALSALYDRLARLPARSITVILDACFSGLGRDGQALVRGTRPTVLSVEHPALVRPQMGVLTAARGVQGAGDLPEARHGLLTYWVARGLRGEADDDGDGAITFAELGRFAERRVRETAARLDREQRPLAIARDSGLVVARLAPER